MYGNLVSDSIWNSIDPIFRLCSVRFSSVTQSCPTFCDPMDCSMPDFPVQHQLPELAQAHVYRVCDAIQPSHPVVPFSSCHQPFPASGSFLRSQFFTSSGQSIGAPASVLPMNIQNWFPLRLTGLISPCSPRDSQESSPTPQFKSINSPALSFLYGPTLKSMQTTGKTIALTRWTFVSKVISLLFNMLVYVFLC